MWRIRQLAVFAIPLAIGACATVSPEQRSFYDRQLERLRSQSVSVIGDGCVVRDDVGDEDYVLIEASRHVAEAATSKSAAYLGGHGLSPRTQVAPFVCGGGVPLLSAHTGGGFLAADMKGSPVTERQLPLSLTDTVRADSALAQAYRDMLTRAENAVVKSEPASNLPMAAPLNLTADQRERLKTAGKAPNVWIVRGEGTQVSAGKTIGTGLVTAALSLGTVVATVGDGYRFEVALVDLDKNQIVWVNHVPVQGGDPASATTYYSDWVRDAFAPFIGDTATEVTQPARAKSPASASPEASAATVERRSGTVAGMAS
jgi:hypothetical protein